MEDLMCARCSGELEELHVGGVTIERCESCRGLFFDSGELSRVLTEGDPGTNPAEAAEADGHGQPPTCPRCQIEMDRLPTGGSGRFAYDVCSACNGMWLDAGELAHLEKASIAAAVEAGQVADTRPARAAAIVEQLQTLIAQIDRQRESRLGRLDKLMEFGLTDAREIRAIRGAIEAEALLGLQALGHSRLFDEARRSCIEGHITGAVFEAIRQRVTV
jgi:uncharacterized protein